MPKSAENSKSHKRHKEKKEKKKKKKEKKSKVKKEVKEEKLSSKLKGELKRAKGDDKRTEDHNQSGEDFSIPIDLMYTKSHVPETPDEFKKRQSQIRRVTDPETGRSRLIKGDGEVIEEIVSKDRHKQINKLATEGDGRHFESKTLGLKQFLP